MQDGKKAWLLLGAAGGAMFGEATLGFYGSKKMVIKVRCWGPGLLMFLNALLTIIMCNR
jgi:hypothetical protein